jgi:hypothetical protein
VRAVWSVDSLEIENVIDIEANTIQIIIVIAISYPIFVSPILSSSIIETVAAYGRTTTSRLSHELIISSCKLHVRAPHTHMNII